MPIKLVPFEKVALKMRAKSANTRNQCVFKTTLEPQDCGKTEIKTKTVCYYFVTEQQVDDYMQSVTIRQLTVKNPQNS